MHFTFNSKSCKDLWINGIWGSEAYSERQALGEEQNGSSNGEELGSANARQDAVKAVPSSRDENDANDAHPPDFT